MQHALDAAVPPESKAPAEQADDWGDWDGDDDSVAEASKPTIQDGDTNEFNVTSLRSQLSTVRLDGAGLFSCLLGISQSSEGKKDHLSSW